MALEEAGGVTVTVPDDTEDEVEMFDSDEENFQQPRTKWGRREDVETEDSQEMWEGEGWQGCERGRAREAGSASGMSKRTTGGEGRRKRGRGGRRGEQGRGRGKAGCQREEEGSTYGGKTRKSMGKKVQFVERPTTRIQTKGSGELFSIWRRRLSKANLTLKWRIGFTSSRILVIREAA